MRNKSKRRIFRTLALMLALCFACLPMMGMAASGEGGGDIDSGEPAPVVIDIVPEETQQSDIAPQETEPDDTEQEPAPETPESTEEPTPQETPAPVCTCEVKCTADAPNPDCPVCAADRDGCTGEAPVPDFTIRILRPDGWYTDKAFVTIRVVDVNKTSWEKVEVRIEKNGAWKDLTDALSEKEKAEVEITENCTLYVSVTDKDGKAHTKSAYIECFDREAPTLRAGIDGELLRVEASDAHSGVACIYVNGYRFTGLVNGTLDVNLKRYADEYEQMSVVAVDHAGNKSRTVQTKNPYYGAEDDDASHNVHCSDDCDCRDAAAPTAAPAQSAPTVTTPAVKSSASTASGGGQTSKPAATQAPDTDSADNSEREVTLEPGTGFSENSNAVTRDLLYDKHTNKQFITIQDRDGNTFYIVIDYDSPLDEEEEQYQTYFLNLVDTADLAALAEDSGEEAACSCTDKCVVGAINTSCPVCAANMSECAGVETAPASTPEPDTAPDADDTPEKENGGSPAILILVLLLLAGGGALYYFKFRKQKPDTKGPADLDDYDYGEDEDDEEYEIEDNTEESKDESL